MKTKKLISITFVLSALLLAACSDIQVEETQKLRPVKHFTVVSGSAGDRERIFSGSANSAQEAQLSFKVKGNIKRIAVEVGDKVKSGDVIAELDPQTYQLELDEATAKVAQSNALRRNTESEYQRVRLLYANNNASQNELDSALANAETAKAAHNADVQHALLARLNLDYTRLLSETDCTIASVDMELNENVSAGETVAQVNCGESWEVEISVAESLIALFKRGMPGKVEFPSIPKTKFDASVTEVGIGTSNSATFPVVFSINNPPENIRSNLAAEVAINLSNFTTRKNTFYVPVEAVMKDELGTFVYVMTASETENAAQLRRRSVDVGEISVLGIEVLNGLSAGERIVSAGQVNARDGMLVRDGR